MSVTLTAMDEFVYVFSYIFPFRLWTASFLGRATFLVIHVTGTLRKR